jgi:hypothetical protein
VGLFSRKQPEVIATGAEIDAAARQLQQGGSSTLADRLCDRAPERDRQSVAMAILNRCADYEPRED